MASALLSKGMDDDSIESRKLKKKKKKTKKKMKTKKKTKKKNNLITKIQC